MASDSKHTEVSYCKIVTCANILKTRGNDKSYQEAIEASSKFNKRLINERKMRIPFIDSQTTVAQANCMIWNMEYQRMKSNKIGYVYRYPVKTWFKNRRLAFENDSSNMLHRLHLPIDLAQQQNNLNENSNHNNLIEPNHHHHHHNNHHHHHHSNVYSKQLSNDDHHHHHHHHHHNNKPNGRLASSSNTVSNSNGSGAIEHDWHDSYENENNDDADSDADEFEDPKRKRGKRGRGKKNQNKDSGTNNSDDKPFVCDRCGVKYKTKPGLAYHVQKAHNNNNNINNTPSTPSMSTVSGSASSHGHNSNLATASKTHDLIDNENTNSVFDSVYDDMNSSSSLPQASSSSHQQNSNTNTNFSATLLASNNIHSSKTNLNNKCGVCMGTEQENRNGQHELFVSCFECNKSFHPLCLNFTGTFFNKKKNFNFFCLFTSLLFL